MKVMNKFKSSHVRAQGLVEYAILIALISLIVIAGLALFGGSIKGGLIKVCAAMGIDNCQTANADPIVVDSTPTLSIPMTSTSVPIPTATPKLSEPDPTRGPAVIFTVTPTTAAALKPLRIKVVAGGKGSAEGIQVAAYDSAGRYVTDGITDNKGNLTLSVPDGSYTVSTFYDGVWQKAGPFSPGSKENVIHR